jgi:beta-N-acetylhexosaminidase
VDELVGQLIWAFVSSSEDIDAVEVSIKKGRVSGVWLLPTEMHGPEETARLVNRLQAASPIPLLIGVDAEAGMGLVMGGGTLLPTAMALGAAADPELVRKAAAVTAAEAAAVGINAVAAPVLDVNINPANPIINTRSYGERPDLVRQMGLAFMEGVAGPAVLPIGKHFPGHGDTVSDSHLQLGIVDQPRARLDAVELPPFQAAIDADIPMLMTSHVSYPALDPDVTVPATLSFPIMTGLLREEMGFQGAVVTDCMNMHAVSHNFEPGEAAVRAVLAGCDLVLTDQWDLAYEALLHAILEDQLRGSQVREGADRVRKVKSRIFGQALARPAPIDVKEAIDAVGTDEHADVARQIADASVTIVSGSPQATGEKPLIMATLMARRFGPSVEAQLRSALAALGTDDVDLLIVNPVPDAVQIEQAVDRAKAAGSAALLHFNRVESFDPDAVAARTELVALAEAIVDAGVLLTVISLGSPYILPGFHRANTRMCSYSTSDASVRATLEVLLDHQEARGRLPVSIRDMAMAE